MFFISVTLDLSKFDKPIDVIIEQPSYIPISSTEDAFILPNLIFSKLENTLRINVILVTKFDKSIDVNL